MKYQNNEEAIHRLHKQAGDDDSDPKTGILLRIYDIEKAVL